MADQWLESTMLNEATNKVSNTAFHLLFLFFLNLVGEYLHTNSSKAGYDLTDSKITVIPKRFHRVVTQSDTMPCVRGSRCGGLATHTQCAWPTQQGLSYRYRCLWGKSWCKCPRLLRIRTTALLLGYSCTNMYHRLVRLHLNCEHEQLIVVDRNIDQSLLEFSLIGTLNRSERRFAVFFDVLEDGIDDLITTAHLNSLEESLIFSHVLEYISLQVAIRYENSAPGNVLKSIFVRLNHLFHCFKRCPWVKNLKDVLIYLLNLLNINLLTSSAKSAETSHRMIVSFPHRLRVQLTFAGLLPLFIFYFFSLNLREFLFDNFLRCLNVSL